MLELLSSSRVRENSVSPFRSLLPRSLPHPPRPPPSVELLVPTAPAPHPYSRASSRTFPSLLYFVVFPRFLYLLFSPVEVPRVATTISLSLLRRSPPPPYFFWLFLLATPRHSLHPYFTSLHSRPATTSSASLASFFSSEDIRLESLESAVCSCNYNGSEGRGVERVRIQPDFFKLSRQSPSFP